MSSITALKILIAGEFEKEKRDWYYNIAQKLANNPETDNIIYFLTNTIDRGVEDLNPEDPGRFRMIGMGKDFNVEWNPAETEEENARRLDIETAKGYFKDWRVTMKATSKEIEVGIGGLNYADSLLFRKLNIPYLKLSEEDVESYTMQKRLNMPVLSSGYPSKQVWSNFHHSELPDLASFGYRYTAYKQYYLNVWDNYRMRQEMKAIVGDKNHYLIDDHDQDHAMVIG